MVGVGTAAALVVAVAVSGGAGAGAQSGPPASGPGPAATAASAEAGPTSEATVSAQSEGEPDDPATAARDKDEKPKKIKIPERGSGTFTRARVDGPKVGAKDARLLRYVVKVEKNLPYDADRTAREIEATLSDRRSWIGGGDWRLQLVSDPDEADFTIFVATPGTVDRYCWPLRTFGRVSCQAGNRVMLNAWRWAHGADAYGDDVDAYRQYLVNHEVGHRLGHRHVSCPGKGKRAPVMMQQTKTVGTCRANPWPAPRRTS